MKRNMNIYIYILCWLNEYKGKEINKFKINKIFVYIILNLF